MQNVAIIVFIISKQVFRDFMNNQDKKGRDVQAKNEIPEKAKKTVIREREQHRQNG